MQQLEGVATDDGVATVAQDELGAAVPVGEGAVEAAHEDGVVGEVEELGLLTQGGGADGELAFILEAEGLVDGDADDAVLDAVLVEHRLVAGRDCAPAGLTEHGERLACEGALHLGDGVGVLAEDDEQVVSDELPGCEADAAEGRPLCEQHHAVHVHRPGDDGDVLEEFSNDLGGRGCHGPSKCTCNGEIFHSAVSAARCGRVSRSFVRRRRV